MKSKIKLAQLSELTEASYLIKLKMDLAALIASGQKGQESSFVLKSNFEFTDGIGTLMIIGLSNEWKQHIKKEKWLLDSDLSKKTWLGTCQGEGKDISLVAQKGKMTASKFEKAMKSNSAFRKYKWNVVEKLSDGDDSKLLEEVEETPDTPLEGSVIEANKLKAQEIGKTLATLFHELNTASDPEERKRILTEIDEADDALYAIPDWRDYTDDKLEELLTRFEKYMAQSAPEANSNANLKKKSENASKAAKLNKTIVDSLVLLKSAVGDEAKIPILENIVSTSIELKKIPLWEDYTDDRIEVAIGQAELKLNELKPAPERKGISVEEFQKSSSKTVRVGFLWLDKKTVRLEVSPESAKVLTVIDKLVGNVEALKGVGGEKYYEELLNLKKYLDSKDVVETTPKVTMMKINGERVTSDQQQHHDSIDGLMKGVKAEIQLFEENASSLFKPYKKASIKEREGRMAYAALKYADHAFLFKDIKPTATDEKAILKELLANFYQRPDYTYATGDMGAFSHKGNCLSLANEFMTIANVAFGINVTSPGYATGPFMVPKRKITGLDMDGNIDGGKDGWIWETHAVAYFGSIPIDVLYGQWGGVKTKTGVIIGKDPNMYYLFGDKKVYLTKGKDAETWATKYTLDPEKAVFK